jgi:hypothetical protein
MKRFVVATTIVSSLLIGLASAPAAWGKPADLPADDKIQCPEGQEKGEHGGISLGSDHFADAPKSPASIDTVSPTLVPACVEMWLQKVGEMFFVQQRDVFVPFNTPERQVRDLFERAEKCRRSGDFANARTNYQRLHMLAPTSRLGRLAIDRIIEIEERMREPAEEAEPPQSFRQMRERSQPLGLVEVTY